MLDVLKNSIKQFRQIARVFNGRAYIADQDIQCGDEIFDLCKKFRSRERKH